MSMRAPLFAACVVLTAGCSGRTESVPPPGATEAPPVVPPPRAAEGAGSNAGSTPGEGPRPAEAACPPPADPAHAAICLALSAEPIDLDADPRFTGRGTLRVAAYATPTPEPASLLGEVVLGAGAPVDLRKLPPVVLGDLPPGDVHLEVRFSEGTATELATPRAGDWIAGYDLAGGAVGARLDPVTLAAGQARPLRRTLQMLRELVVRAHRTPGVSPVGDGKGPLRAVASAAPELDTKKGIRLFGEAEASCVDLSGGASAVARGWVVGPGPYWVFALLDDFGEGGLGPQGSLLSIAGTTPTAILLPQENKLEPGATAPAVTLEVELGTAAPPSGGLADGTTCP